MNVCSIFNSKSISTTTTTKYGSTKQCLLSLWFLLCSDLAIVLISSFAQAAKNSLPFAKKTKKKNGDDLMWKKKNRRSSDAICMRVNEKKDSVQRINDAIEEFRQLETVKYQMLNLSPKRRIKMVRHNFFVSFFFFLYIVSFHFVYQQSQHLPLSLERETRYYWPRIYTKYTNWNAETTKIKRKKNNNQHFVVVVSFTRQTFPIFFNNEQSVCVWAMGPNNNTHLSKFFFSLFYWNI